MWYLIVSIPDLCTLTYFTYAGLCPFYPCNRRTVEEIVYVALLESLYFVLPIFCPENGVLFLCLLHLLVAFQTSFIIEANSMSLNQIWVHSDCNIGYEKAGVICRYSRENMLAVSCVCGTDYSLCGNFGVIFFIQVQ